MTTVLDIPYPQFCLVIEDADLSGATMAVTWDTGSGATTTSVPIPTPSSVGVDYFINGRAGDAEDLLRNWLDEMEVALTAAGASCSFELQWDTWGGAMCPGYYQVVQTAGVAFTAFTLVFVGQNCATSPESGGPGRGAWPVCRLLGFTGTSNQGASIAAGAVTFVCQHQPRRLWCPMRLPQRIEAWTPKKGHTSMRPFDGELVRNYYSQPGALKFWQVDFQNLPSLLVRAEAYRLQHFRDQRPYPMGTDDVGISLESGTHDDLYLVDGPWLMFEDWTDIGIGSTKRWNVELYQEDDLNDVRSFARETQTGRQLYDVKLALKRYKRAT